MNTQDSEETRQKEENEYRMKLKKERNMIFAGWVGAVLLFSSGSLTENITIRLNLVMIGANVLFLFITIPMLIKTNSNIRKINEKLKSLGLIYYWGMPLTIFISTLILLFGSEFLQKTTVFLLFGWIASLPLLIKKLSKIAIEEISERPKQL